MCVPWGAMGCQCWSLCPLRVPQKNEPPTAGKIGPHLHKFSFHPPSQGHSGETSSRHPRALQKGAPECILCVAGPSACPAHPSLPAGELTDPWHKGRAVWESSLGPCPFQVCFLVPLSGKMTDQGANCYSPTLPCLLHNKHFLTGKLLRGSVTLCIMGT